MSAIKTLPSRSEIPHEYTWNLASIYPTDSQWEADFARVTALLADIRAFEGRMGESGEVLLQALQVRDSASELWGRLFVYANMRMHEDSANSTYQGLADRATTLANDLNTSGAYMTPEILAIPQEKLDGFVEHTAGLKLYRQALDEINRERPHVLSAEMEGLLAQAGEVGNAPEHIFEMLNNA